MTRRKFIQHFLSFGAVMLIASRGALSFAAETIAQITKTKDEWMKILTPAQYNILREEGTEPPFSSSLLGEHRQGTFVCAGCDLELFPSNYKFESGTGWPSFYDVIPGHIVTKLDLKLLMMPREEYHCVRCGGHQGHVFKDGPQPTGLRYCNNGLALKFVPKV